IQLIKKLKTMAIRGKKVGIELYFKIMEIRLIKRVVNEIKTTECHYQAWLFKDKASADQDDNNAIVKLDFLKFELGQGNNYEQQCYAHLKSHLGNDWIEDVVENGNGEQLKQK